MCFDEEEDLYRPVPMRVRFTSVIEARLMGSADTNGAALSRSCSAGSRSGGAWQAAMTAVRRYSYRRPFRGMGHLLVIIPDPEPFDPLEAGAAVGPPPTSFHFHLTRCLRPWAPGAYRTR